MHLRNIISGFVFACFFLATITAPAHADSKIFYAVVPMGAKEAKFLTQKLVAKGMSRELAREFPSYLATTEFDNSRPLFIPARTGYVCVATAMRYDIDKVMKFAPSQDEDTRRAVQDYLLAHEASHCREAQSTLKQLLTEEDDKEFEGYPLWLEESLADHRAQAAAHQWGRAGYNAVTAWDRRRLLDLLTGDLDHWSTPLLRVMGAKATAGHADMALAGTMLGGEAAYQSIQRGWFRLKKALFVGEEGSIEQAAAWDAAVNLFSEGLRSAIPTLEELRKTAREIWPDSVDWRLKVTGREKPPS